MLHKIDKEQKFFLDIPEQISTTGHAPSRGVYIRIRTDNDDNPIWLDRQYRGIYNENWKKKLNEYFKTWINT